MRTRIRIPTDPTTTMTMTMRMATRITTRQSRRARQASMPMPGTHRAFTTFSPTRSSANQSRFLNRCRV